MGSPWGRDADDPDIVEVCVMEMHDAAMLAISKMPEGLSNQTALTFIGVMICSVTQIIMDQATDAGVDREKIGRLLANELHAQVEREYNEHKGSPTGSLQGPKASIH